MIRNLTFVFGCFGKTTRIICDKSILSGCIQKWFGSIENFDDLVRREVREAFTKQVMWVPFGYLWFFCEVVAIHAASESIG